MGETVVLAIGGNALAPAGLGDFAGQEERARGVADAAVRLLDSDRRLLMVHGNGPQVGALAMAQEAVAREVPVQPLFVLGAMTQGQLGYLLSQAIGDALASAGRPRSVAAVMTQVGVREDDLIPGVTAFNPLDVLDSALTAWRNKAFQLNTWTV